MLSKLIVYAATGGRGCWSRVSYVTKSTLRSWQAKALNMTLEEVSGGFETITVYLLQG